MKKITSATGSKIRFALRGDSVFMFEPEEAVIVSDLDAEIISQRLGTQLVVVDINYNDAQIMVENNEATTNNTSGVSATPAPEQAQAETTDTTGAQAGADTSSTGDAPADASNTEAQTTDTSAQDAANTSATGDAGAQAGTDAGNTETQ